MEMNRKRVEKILKSCVGYRMTHPWRLPGQTEQLCRELLKAWDTIDAIYATQRSPSSVKTDV